MTYNKLLSLWQKKAIKENKEESAILILMLNAFKLTQTDLYIKMDEKPDKDKIEQFEKDCNKYIYDNIPCQYITGEAYFYGYNYNVNEDVLIPRHETEELVENILKLYDHNFKGQKVKTVDVGTGSGCISCTLALEEKNMEVYATDISFEALKVAKSNSDKFGANVSFLQGDMLEPLKGMKFDILVSNPPYIPTTEEVDSLVKDNEPNLALFGGNDGLKFYRIILSNAKELLNDKFIMGFEHGYDKSKEIEDLARTYFPDALIYSLKDLQGKDRMTFVLRGCTK